MSPPLEGLPGTPQAESGAPFSEFPRRPERRSLQTPEGGLILYLFTPHQAVRAKTGIFHLQVFLSRTESGPRQGLTYD